MPSLGPNTQHLLRRAGFGTGPSESETFNRLRLTDAVDLLVNYEQVQDNVDRYIGNPEYVGVTVRTQWAPNTSITDARQRWLFRMVHSERPLEEKMALFWHNHFATGYGKVAGVLGSTDGTRAMAAVPAEDPGRVEGQIETFRRMAVGSFRDLLVAMAKDVAMLVWLDGRLNTRTRPQENFGREIMELFTMGVGFYTESDVYAAARVFTGWNIQRVGVSTDPASRYEFVFNASQHETSEKTFSFPIYPDGRKTIAARAASDGMQDGLDLINALVIHPETARRLARKLCAFFLTEIDDPGRALIEGLASTYLQNDTEIRPVLEHLFTSGEFYDPKNIYARYAWPVEYVARTLKEAGWKGYTVNDALTPLATMGQQLFEPPNVAGWELGEHWFSSGAMLARMSFAATLARTQRAALASAVKPYAATPDSFLHYFLDRLDVMPLDSRATEDLRSYLLSGGAWSTTDTALQTKAGGLVHLIAGSPQHQFV